MNQYDKLKQELSQVSDIYKELRQQFKPPDTSGYDPEPYEEVRAGLKQVQSIYVDLRRQFKFHFEKDFDEDKHPRKKDGKFAPKGQGEEHAPANKSGTKGKPKGMPANGPKTAQGERQGTGQGNGQGTPQTAPEGPKQGKEGQEAGQVPSGPKRGSKGEVLFGQVEQRHAEKNQERLAESWSGSKAIPGNAPSDLEKESAKIRHQVEMKTFLVNKRGRCKMTSAAMARKMARYEQHPPPPTVRQWTCVIDHREHYGNGKLEEAKAFPCYVKEGVGAYNIKDMHKVNNQEEFDKLLATPAADLPDRAKSTSKGFYARYMSATKRQKEQMIRKALKNERQHSTSTKKGEH